jgi:hypothetical protein
MISEPTLRSALVVKIKENDPKARVHRRIRYPKANRIAEYLNLLRDEDNLFNAYMIRRVRRTPTLRGIPQRLVQVEHQYEIRCYFGLKDDDDDSVATEEIVTAKLEALAALIETETEQGPLGLGATVSHDGLELPTDFEDKIIGDWAFHRPNLRITITVKNSNCE